MRPSEETKAQVVALHGGRHTVGDVAHKFGLTRGQVTGIWHRRPRAAVAQGAPPPVAGDAGPAPVPGVAAQIVAWTPGTAALKGQAAAALAALVAAGDAGATREAMLLRIYPHGIRPASAKTAVDVALVRLRDVMKPHGYAIVSVDGVAPTRWRIRGPDAPAAPDAAAAAPGPAAVPLATPLAGTPAPPAPPAGPRDAEPAPDVPAPASGRVVAIAPAAGAPATLAEAFAALTPAGCRWPLGEPQEPGFRFCCAPVRVEGKPYCAEHTRRASERAPASRRTA